MATSSTTATTISSLSHQIVFSSVAGRIGKRDDDLATCDGHVNELHAYYRAHSSWRVYHTFYQLRVGYIAFLVLMGIAMFSFTLMMEIFFAIFLPSAKNDPYYIPRSIALLVTLRVALFFLSYFYEEATRVFFDAIDKKDGALPKFRLALAVVIHYLRHRNEMHDPRSVARHSSLEHGTDPNGSDGETSDSSLGSIVLLGAKDDPFLDTGKDDEDLVWEEHEQEDIEEHVEVDAVADTDDVAVAADAQITSQPAFALGIKRWKRAKAAVSTTLLAKKVEYEGPQFDVSTFVVVDVCCLVLFEVATAVALVTELRVSWSPTKAFLAYIQMGFWVVSAYLVVWVITHFYSSRNSAMRALASSCHHQRIMRRTVNELERQNRAKHLWLFDVGFRFYYHVAHRANVTTWWRTRAATKKSTRVPNGLHVQTNSASHASVGIVSIDVQSAPTARDHDVPKRQRPKAAIVAVAGRMQAAHERVRSRNPWRKLSYSAKATILFVLVIGAALVSFYSFFVGWPIMGALLIALSTVIQRRFPQVFGHAFQHFVKAFVVLSLVFFSSTFLIGTFVAGGDFQLGPFVNSTEYAITPTAPTTSTVSTDHAVTTFSARPTSEYPACTIDYDGLSVLDLALLADAAYGATTAAHMRSIENRFNGTMLSDWTYVARSNESTDHQVWFELYFPSANMTVIAVRGTASAADALEDLHYWFGITIMQALDVFVPFLKQLPRAFVVKLLSMDLIARVMSAPVYMPLLEHVTRVRARVGKNVVVTGHSLGGAMAAMVGAKTQTRAVSFSGPGLLYSRGRFGVDARDVRDYVLTFKPRKDIVPRVDELGGMVQELRCKEASPMKCHSSWTHLCELFLSCGDARQRNWAANAECRAYEALPPDAEDDS